MADSPQARPRAPAAAGAPLSEALVDAVVGVAREAAQRILAIYETEFSVRHKDDASPLTAADTAAHRAIAEGLARLAPGLPLLSEESAPARYAERARWPRYWLVDPLDGTREFVKRNGEFTVNIALVEGHRPVLGVVVVPVSGVAYRAARGFGAWRSDGPGPAARLRVRPVPAGPLTVVASRSHGSGETEAFIARLGPVERVSIGSSLKICLVAEGRADLYPRFGPTSEWDTAAAQCVLEEAGGHLTDLALEPLRYNTRDTLLNPEFLAFGERAGGWRQHLPAPCA